ncbi:integral membrane protein [Aspergillus ellipticus CBS 707.79]|uniref:Integral membrane protein n=1 Tax=Aspergillus ellipticus CBS 707.79 TaxID=1448320 RepID=A0A319D1S3_9EURO|nr:integral membrane protein [Aspergillus ellipticus CBS 707.79]
MSPSPKGKEIIVIVSVLVGLATVSTALRVVARLKRQTGFGLDDYLCFVSIVLMIGMLVELILWCDIGGNGYHVYDLNPRTIELFYQIFLANQFTYFALTPAIKISIICFFRRLFTTERFLRFTFYLSTLIALWSTGIFLACAFQCRPLRAFWDNHVDGKCFNGMVFIIVNQAFNVVMDFVILAAPVPMIWSLHRSWQDKLALNAVFALGGFVCFASIYRIVVLFYIDSTDETYTIWKATLWTHIEPSVGLVVSCLPIIRGMFPRFMLGSQKKNTGSSPINSGPSPTAPGETCNDSSDTKNLLCKEDGIRGRLWNRDMCGHELKDITIRTDIEVAVG